MRITKIVLHLVLLILLLAIICSGCYFGLKIPPEMVDRTEGWDVSLPKTARVTIDSISQSWMRYAEWKEVLLPIEFTPYGPVPEERVEEFAEDALRIAFGSNHESKATIKQNFQEDAWIYRSENTLVVLKRATEKC